MKRAGIILGLLIFAGCGAPDREGYVADARDRGDSSEHLSDGVRMFDEGRYDEALRLMSLAISLVPDDDRAYYYRALVHHKKGDIDAALADLTDSVRVNVRNHLAWTQRGWIYHHNRGNYKKALYDFDMAIEANAEHADAWYLRGRTYQSLKVFGRAIQNIEKAIEIGGGKYSAEALSQLRICRAQANQQGWSGDRRPLNPK